MLNEDTAHDRSGRPAGLFGEGLIQQIWAVAASALLAFPVGVHAACLLDHRIAEIMRQVEIFNPIPSLAELRSQCVSKTGWEDLWRGFPSQIHPDWGTALASALCDRGLRGCRRHNSPECEGISYLILIGSAARGRVDGEACRIFMRPMLRQPPPAGEVEGNCRLIAKGLLDADPSFCLQRGDPFFACVPLFLISKGPDVCKKLDKARLWNAMREKVEGLEEHEGKELLDSTVREIRQLCLAGSAVMAAAKADDPALCQGNRPCLAALNPGPACGERSRQEAAQGYCDLENRRFRSKWIKEMNLAAARARQRLRLLDLSLESAVEGGAARTRLDEAYRRLDRIVERGVSGAR